MTSSAGQRVVVVGGGVAGLLTVQALLDRADDQQPRDAELSVTLLVHQPGYDTASRSGGLALRYASTDPRGDAWATRSAQIAADLARRHAHVGPHVSTTRALLVSRRGPLHGYPGRVVDPAALGLTRHGHAVEHAEGPQWDTCGLLARWPAALAADPRVRLIEMPARLTSLEGLVALHDEHRGDTTVACLGLGAQALGDTRLSGRLGVLVRGPLPEGSVHAERAVIDDDDALRPRYTVPHRSDPAGSTDQPGHLHVGGTYLPIDDPADWVEPTRLAARAHAEVPSLLADAAELFPDLVGWRPDSPVWWGLRPVRDTVALGRIDPALVGARGMMVTHGWGGSGWTIGPAIAEEIARSVLPDGGPDPLQAHGWWTP